MSNPEHQQQAGSPALLEKKEGTKIESGLFTAQHLSWVRKGWCSGVCSSGCWFSIPLAPPEDAMDRGLAQQESLREQYQTPFPPTISTKDEEGDLPLAHPLRASSGSVESKMQAPSRMAAPSKNIPSYCNNPAAADLLPLLSVILLQPHQHPSNASVPLHVTHLAQD